MSVLSWLRKWIASSGRRDACGRPDVAAASHVGRTRESNEDSFLVVRLPGADDALLAVADGVGGEEAGEIASYFALRSLLQARLARQGTKGAGSLSQSGDLREVLTAGLENGNRLLAHVNSQLGGVRFCMGTTVVAIAFQGARALLAHAGDSRCYHWRRGRLTQLTRDDTLAQTLYEEGRISAGDIIGHPWQHTLMNCLGLTGELRVSYDEVDCRPGDRFLLCTDGVYHMLPDAALADCVATADCAHAAVSAVIRESLRVGGRDNITAGAAYF